MQSLDSIETYAYETRKDLVSDKEKTKCNETIQKMIDFDDVVKEIIKNIIHKFVIIHIEY